MPIDPVFAASLLGLVLGLQHATDADHLVAVGTIVSRERKFGDGALIGALWGLGHTATLTVAGLVVVTLDVRVVDGVARALEIAVALTLVLLGLLRLRETFRGFGAVPTDHLVADHDHGGREVLHSHPHAHDDAVHRHPHVHPSRRLLAALSPGHGRLALRPIAVGAVHGLAGTAAVSLLVLATTRSPWAAAVYLGLFGVGTIVGMTALTAAMAYPMGVALRFGQARRALGVVAGLASIALGVVYGWNAI